MFLFQIVSCIENEDLVISQNIVNRHDFSYLYNPAHEICQNENITLLVYGIVSRNIFFLMKFLIETN